MAPLLRILLLSLSTVICSTAIFSQNTFPTTGNVGVGTISPTAPLHIINGVGNTILLEKTSNNYPAIAFKGANYISLIEGGDALNFSTNGMVRVNVGATGNVGIGTAFPASALHINSAGAAIDTWGQYNGNVIIQGNTGERSMSNGAALEFAIPANTDGSNVWGQSRILTVSGNLNNGDATGKMIFGTRRSFSKNGGGIAWYYGDDLVIDGTGNIGMGTLNPGAQLQVRGTAIIGNPGGGSYNENLRLPVANDDYACIALGTDNSAAGAISGQWSLVRNPATMNTRFSIRHMNDELFSMQTNGNVGIGTVSPSEKLSVNGNIRSKKVIVTQTGWPDYVFDSAYQLPSLDSVADFIQLNKHLPDMPSAAVVEKDGHDLGEVQKALLKKVEELTLYMIEQCKYIKKLETRVEKLELIKK